MAMSAVLRSVFAKNLSDLVLLHSPAVCQVQLTRGTKSWRLIEKPKPGINGKAYRRFVHFKDEYTVEPLQVTNLAGRDPITGRVVAKGIGGGIKHKFHWIQWKRDGPTDVEVPPKEEKVLAILEEGCRTAHIALVGHGSEIKYYLASENMKPGQIIRTSRAIPRMPVRAFEGDAYPLGALPVGTVVYNIEKFPGKGGTLINAAGTSGTIIRKDGVDRVVVQMPSKRLFSLHYTCLACVGRVSNVLHGDTPIGSAQRNRELGNRPRSGLWQRKTGRFGRKIKPPRPIKYYNPDGEEIHVEEMTLTHSAFNTNLDCIRKPSVPIKIKKQELRPW
ncbi:39S ribosomal protein L2, mitochondrial [Diachasma alloeum]|uniref:39S ribosomal protein L2, mitochondrial n=1 Tax=Diachasma alloeum TaxID=454923 RepID=UPI0007381279|nr:39S ribosomal protein L2, mitochondrial [Diachasma alloeum]